MVIAVAEGCGNHTGRPNLAASFLNGSPRAEASTPSKARGDAAHQILLQSDLQPASPLYHSLYYYHPPTDRDCQPCTAKSYLSKGYALEEAGRLEEAHTLYVAATGIDPHCVDALFSLGVINTKRRHYKAALQAFEALYCLLPEHQEVLSQLASCHEALGSTKQALHFFQRLRLQAPGDHDLLARLGAIHIRIGDQDLASGYFQESLRLFPGNVTLISWLAYYHARQEEYVKALHLFDQAAKIQPGVGRWVEMAAVCYRRINRALASELHAQQDLCGSSAEAGQAAGCCSGEHSGLVPPQHGAPCGCQPCAPGGWGM